MDTLDWVVVGLLVVSCLHGLRVGAVVQLLSFAGVVLGLVAGVALVAKIGPYVHGSFARTFVSILLLVLPSGILGGAGRHLGSRLWGRMRGHALARLDAVGGAAIAMAGTLLFVWLLASVLVVTPISAVSSEIENSRIIEKISSVMPPLPPELGSVERLLEANGLPIVLDTGPLAPVSLPHSAVVRAAVRAAGGSTVQVTAFGCDGGDLVDKGSGFVVAPGLVVTNAHVVAGSDHVVVSDEAGYHDADPVSFDARYDLAVLRVPGLSDRPLRLDPGYVARGTKAVVLGYPGGGRFTADAAGVVALLDATGYDIYGNALTTREMYEIQSLVRPGNSGGPLVEANGEVVGIVFSRQAGDEHIGYALASPGVLSRVARVEREHRRRAVATGSCISG